MELLEQIGTNGTKWNFGTNGTRWNIQGKMELLEQYGTNGTKWKIGTNGIFGTNRIRLTSRVQVPDVAIFFEHFSRNPLSQIGGVVRKMCI